MCLLIIRDSLVCIDIISLIDIGADVNWKSSAGDTPLIAASRRGHLETVNLLIRNGANVDISSDIDLNSPFHVACLRGDVMAIKLLLTANANTNLQNKDGLTGINYLLTY